MKKLFISAILLLGIAGYSQETPKFIVVEESVVYTRTSFKYPVYAKISKEYSTIQCIGTTKEGNRCKRMTKSYTGYCNLHK